MGCRRFKSQTDPKQAEPVCLTLLGHFPSKSNISWWVYKLISASLASVSPYHTRYDLWLEYEQQGCHGNPCPGCENVVLGILIPGGSLSPIDPSVGGIQEESVLNYVPCLLLLHVRIRTLACSIKMPMQFLKTPTFLSIMFFFMFSVRTPV